MFPCQRDDKKKERRKKETECVVRENEKFFFRFLFSPSMAHSQTSRLLQPIAENVCVCHGFYYD
jgi:hypothetical protein